MRVNFDHYSISSGGNRSQSHGSHQIPLTRAMARVSNNRQMTDFLNYGVNAYIHGVTGIGFKRSDTSFAKDEMLVTLSQDVFSGQQPLLNRSEEHTSELQSR